MSIISIQSHVAYGYVGNKAAVYPLQSMGYDVWPINTVQFSNHTGYGKWKGEFFSANHIRDIIKGLQDLGVAHQCKAILSGYMGSGEICQAVQDAAKEFKATNSELVYLCDPVIGNGTCYVKPEVLEFFKTNLQADIITPNQYEAEILSNIKIQNTKDLYKVSDYFHNLGIKILIITGIESKQEPGKLSVFISCEAGKYIVETKEYKFDIPVNGTGDLFSALYLGAYLSSRDALNALQKAIGFMDIVLANTQKAKTRELQVLSARYQDPLLSIPTCAKI